MADRAVSHPEDKRPWSWDQPRPYAFIQWKGTEVCTDLYCECGEQWHLDDDFTYSVRCPHCKRVWLMEPYVRLHPTTDPHDIEYAVEAPPGVGYFGAPILQQALHLLVEADKEDRK